jgi:hypothetical protein
MCESASFASVLNVPSAIQSVVRGWSALYNRAQVAVFSVDSLLQKVVSSI